MGSRIYCNVRFGFYTVTTTMLNRAVDPSTLNSRPDVADGVIHLAAMGPPTGESSIHRRVNAEKAAGEEPAHCARQV